MTHCHVSKSSSSVGRTRLRLGNTSTCPQDVFRHIITYGDSYRIVCVLQAKEKDFTAYGENIKFYIIVSKISFSSSNLVNRIQHKFTINPQ